MFLPVISLQMRMILFLILCRGDLEEVCRQLVIEENVSQIIEQLGGGNTGKISYDDFCRNKSILVSGMNTGHTSSSESNSAPEFWTDTEYSTKNKQFVGEIPKRKEKDIRMERIGEFLHFILASFSLAF